jgi:hypothetical protein
MNINKPVRLYFKFILLAMAVIVLFILFKLYNPYVDSLIPPCPFYTITGLKCPGCGSLRAIYNLFNLEFVNAFNENPLLIISVPYLLLLFYFNLSSLKLKRDKKISNILFRKNAIIIALSIILGFWVIRNII